MKRLFLALAFSVFAGAVFAQSDDSVVIAEDVELDIPVSDFSALNDTVYTAEEIAKSEPLNLTDVFLKFPFYLFFPSQCLPPTPTSRTNLWNPCRVPPVTHNACTSHGQHRRPPKILMFGDPLC